MGRTGCGYCDEDVSGGWNGVKRASCERGVFVVGRERGRRMCGTGEWVWFGFGWMRKRVNG